jgi:hypothetical protein
MALLATKTTLRSLGLVSRVCCGPEFGPLLSQLTQLTKLRLLLEEDPDQLYSSSDQSTSWSRAVHGLVRNGLCRLAVSAALLQQLEVGSLTSLTHLQLEFNRPRTGSTSTSINHALPPYTWHMIRLLLRRLVPLAGGQLQEVGLVGVKACMRDCRAAVAAAVGDVKVVFF